MAARGEEQLSPEPADWLGAVLDRFAAAERAAGPNVVELAVGGRAVRLRFAGPALAPKVVPALAHLVAPAAVPPTLTVALWDSASTGVAMLPPPFAWTDLRADGAVRGLDAGRVRAHVRVDIGLVSVVDVEVGQAVVWVRDAQQIDRYEAAAPLRSVLAAAFEPRGLCVVHAGAVGGPEGGVLLGGRGGSGKSTTALLALEAGLGYVGDDHVLLDPEAPYVHSLYATGKVAPSGPRRFDFVFDHAPPGEKRIADLSGRMTRGFPVRALLLPRVTGSVDTRLEPISAAAALRGLAPSTLFQLGGSGPGTLAALGRLVGRVPSFAFYLGTDLAQIPAAIENLLGGRT
jgi:hypothetical protein